MKRRIELPILATIAFLVHPATGQGTRPAPAPAGDFVRADPAEPLPPHVAASVAALRAPALAAHIRFLASPALEGRGLAARGLDAAAEYAAAGLALAGVPPLPNQTYFQPVPLREITRALGEVEVERRRGDGIEHRTFVSGTDCLIPQIPARCVTAPVVFAGYGIRESAPARDDYRGLDVKGKVVVVREGLPPGDAFSTKALRSKWAEGDSEERWAEKVNLAKALGAVGVLAVEGESWTARLRGKEKPWPFAFRQLDESSGADPLVVRCAPGVLEALLGASPMPDE